MIIKMDKLVEKIAWLATVLLFSLNFIFESYTWGRYVFFGISVLIFFLAVLRGRGVIRLSFSSWHLHMALLSLFSLVTSLWSISPADSRQKAVTMLLSLLCMALVYLFYHGTDSVIGLVTIVKWMGYVITVYAFFFYGFENITHMLEESARLNNEFSNVNTIGMLAAMSVVIQTYEILYMKKWRLSMLLSIPCIVMVAATQSRKALILMGLGIFLVGIANLGMRKNVLKTLLGIGIALGALVLILRLPIFSGVNERMEDIWTMLSGGDQVGASAEIRNKMVALGWKTFLENPMGGVGIGAPHVLAASYLDYDAYLHNNYVELLAGGGLVGFVLYYWLYAYLLISMYRLRAYRNPEYRICLIMMVLLLVMDWGLVAAYSRSTYFYFLIFVLEVACLKKKKEAEDNGQAVARVE